jgi:hypothetical protein
VKQQRGRAASFVEAGARRFIAGLPRRVFLFGMLLGSALMTLVSLPYFDFEELPPFVIEKLPLRFEELWLASLRIHVASALVSFPLCLVLMTRWLQRRAAWHRWLGRVAGVLVLVLMVPSGVLLAFEAKGGAVVTAGFLLSALIVGWFSVHGVLAARRRELAAHGRAMRHVVGQMSVAVTSRALIVGFDAAGIDPDVAYTVALWVPVLFTALIAELVSARPRLLALRFFPLLERIRREVAPLARLRARAVARPLARLGR